MVDLNGGGEFQDGSHEKAKQKGRLREKIKFWVEVVGLVMAVVTD